jgi:mannose-6-phosphate isomerase class I
MINLKQEIQNFKWTHHKLDDNFGMTFEQSKKVNELIMLAHNNAVDEMSQLFDLYLEEAKEFERG